MVKISRCGGEVCVVLAVLLVVARILVSLVIMFLVVVELCVNLWWRFPGSLA